MRSINYIGHNNRPKKKGLFKLSYKIITTVVIVSLLSSYLIFTKFQEAEASISRINDQNIDLYNFADASFVGEAEGDAAGYYLGNIGDINNDGNADFAITSNLNSEVVGGGGFNSDNWIPVSGSLTPPSVGDTTTDTTNAQDVTNVNFSHEVLGTDNLLLVSIIYNDGGSSAATSVTFDGDDLTLVCHRTSTDYAADLWYLAGAAEKVGDIDIDFGGSGSRYPIVHATNITGVDTADPISHTSCATDSGWTGDPQTTYIETSITADDQDLIWAVGNTYTDGSDLTEYPDLTEVSYDELGWNEGAIGYQINDTGSTDSFLVGWENIRDWPWSLVTASIRPVGAASLNTPEVGTNTTHTANNTSYTSFSHTISGEDNILIVSVAYHSNSISDVSYRGQSLTEIFDDNNSDYGFSMWYLTGPYYGVSEGGGTVEITFTGSSGSIIAQATTISNVQVDDPFRNTDYNNSGYWSGDPIETQMSTSGDAGLGDMFFGGLNTYIGGTVLTPEPGMPFTEIYRSGYELSMSALAWVINSDDSQEYLNTGVAWRSNIDWPFISGGVTIKASTSIAGTTGAGGYGAGQTYIFFGDETNVFEGIADISLGDADASYIGYQYSEEESLSGAFGAVSGIGDINGDGIDDFAIGSYHDDWDMHTFGSGRIYIFFGKTTGWTADNPIQSADSILYSSEEGTQAGFRIRPAGDVNNDNYDDFLIGSYGLGNAWLVLGRDTNNWIPELNLQENSTEFSGNGAGGFVGWGIDGIGDINDDGYDDFAVAEGYVYNQKGQTYIVLGQSSWGSSFNLATQAYASFIGNDNNEHASAVRGAGDLDGDDIPDIVIGADNGGPDDGGAYVFLGKSFGDWTMGMNAYTACDASFWHDASTPVSDMIGDVIGVGGDVNQDGFNDFLVGGAEETATTFLVFGSDEENYWTQNRSFDEISSSFVEVSGSPTDFTGTSVDIVGDIDNDGFDDILIAGPDATVGSDYSVGRIHLVFGDYRKNQVENLDASLDAINEAGENIEKGSSYYAGRETITIEKSGATLAEIPMNLDPGDRDLNGLTADMDLEGNKAFLHYPGGATSIPGIDASTYTLRIPREESDTAVYICPGATSLSELSASCSGVELLDESSPRVTITEVSGQSYWVVTGLNGTGGFSFPSGTNFPPVGPTMRVDLTDDTVNATDDVDIWFEPASEITQNNSLIQVVYEGSEFTGGENLTTSDITVYCDADGLYGGTMTGMTTVTVDTANSGVLILDTGTDSCTEWIHIDIHGPNHLTNPASSGNYSFAIVTDIGGAGTSGDMGATLAYVADDNDVEITTVVPPTIDMELYQQGTDTELTDTNTCALGVLSLNQINTCIYDLGTGTNNTTGVSVYMTSDGPLDDGLGNSFDTPIVAVVSGEEGYGFFISEQGGTEYTIAGNYSTPHQAVPASATLIASTSTTGSGTTVGSSVQHLEITHAASMSTSTIVGSYSQVVTYTAYTN